MPAIDGRTPELAEAIVATIREPLLVLDSDFVVLTANQAFYSTYRTSPEETIGRPLFELGDGQWDAPELRTLLEEVLPRDAQFADYEVQHDFDHIGARRMLLNARRLSAGQDVGEMILLAIEVAKKALEQRNRELQDFAYVASHDLQEPLRKISAFAGLLREEQADRLDEDGRHHLERVEDAAARMTTLIQDLLSFSRVATREEQVDRIALSDVVEGVLDDLSHRIDSLGAEVDVGPLPEIEADPMQMRQLFQNLLSNALKYQPEGQTPRLRIWAEERPREDGNRWILRVQDNGIGFEQQFSERIFSPFKRLHGRDSYDGTGMGLAICRRIVDRHDGHITAESTPGEGTTFVIDLPDTQPPLRREDLP